MIPEKQKKTPYAPMWY